MNVWGGHPMFVLLDKGVRTCVIDSPYCCVDMKGKVQVGHPGISGLSNGVLSD